MRYKLSLMAILLVALISGCSKEYESIEVEDERAIQEYIQRNNLNVQEYNNTGIYYQVMEEGTGEEVSFEDKVFVTFSINTLNGSYKSDDDRANRYASFLGYFDKSHGYPDAWRTAIHEILKKKGGVVRVIIPSHLAYGRSGKGDIPGNASLDCVLRLYDVNNQTEFEEIFVRRYIDNNNITGLSRLNSGLYYNILSPGTGTDEVLEGSSIVVAYTGKLTDGTVFDQSDSAKFVLDQNIRKGWIQGLPLIKEGGKIRLIMPPALGYGSQATGPIPANSILDFEVHLKDLSY